VIYLGWTAVEPDGGPGEGPWSDVFALAPGLYLFDSEATRSHVYHALKWSLPKGTGVLVATLEDDPKFLGVNRGARVWLRSHPPSAGG
jgi:hypothetical protein